MSEETPRAIVALKKSTMPNYLGVEERRNSIQKQGHQHLARKSHNETAIFHIDPPDWPCI
jgi:hypothetical protein